MPKRKQWFQLPDEDEATLAALVEKHGLAPVLAVLTRLQQLKETKEKGLTLLREVGL